MRFVHIPLFATADASQPITSRVVPAETLAGARCIVHGLANARGQLRLEGSIDGDHWVTIDSVTFDGDSGDVGTLQVGSPHLFCRWVRLVYDGEPGDPTPAVPPANEIQQWSGAYGATGGTFTISDGETVSDPIAADVDVEAATQAAADLIWGAGNVAVTIPDGPPQFEFVGDLAEQPMPLVIIDAGDLEGTPAVNAKWTLSVVNATGGTFAISRNGAKAEGLAYDASAQDIEEALNANLGYGDVFSASGGPLNTNPVIIEAVGALSGEAGNVVNLNLTDDELTGEGAYVDLPLPEPGADAIVPTGEVVRVQAGTPGSPEIPADPGELNADLVAQGWP